MKNLSKVLENKTLNDLQEEKVSSGSNLKEPTEDMLNKILGYIKAGKSFWDIQVAIKKEFEQGISKGQLKVVKRAMQNKIVELTPKPVVEEGL